MQDKQGARDAATTTLLVLAHPYFERSSAQRGLLAQTVSDRRVRVHDLYETYPDFAVNVRREQAILLAHDTVLLHFPMFWYSTPALLKEWIDVVFLSGFAFGPGGRLGGKLLACAVSTGQAEDTYRAPGLGTIDDFLLPLRATASFCGMRWATPFAVHGALGNDDLLRYADWREALSGAGAT